MSNADGGSMPTDEDFLPKPDYRGRRYSETPEFKRKMEDLGDDATRARYAMALIQMRLGVDGKDLLPAVSNLLDEHREYEIRLGLKKPFYFCGG